MITYPKGVFCFIFRQAQKYRRAIRIFVEAWSVREFSPAVWVGVLYPLADREEDGFVTGRDETDQRINLQKFTSHPPLFSLLLRFVLI